MPTGVFEGLMGDGLNHQSRLMRLLEWWTVYGWLHIAQLSNPKLLTYTKEMPAFSFLDAYFLVLDVTSIELLIYAS
jgi:hypothetical protein